MRRFKTGSYGLICLSVLFFGCGGGSARQSGSEPPILKANESSAIADEVLVEYLRSSNSDLRYEVFKTGKIDEAYLPTQVMGLVVSAEVLAEDLVGLYRCEGYQKSSFYSTHSDCSDHPFQRLLTVKGHLIAQVFKSQRDSQGEISNLRIPLYRYRLEGRDPAVYVLSTIQPREQFMRIMRYEFDPQLRAEPLGYIQKSDALLDGNQRWMAGSLQNLCYGIASYQKVCPETSSKAVWRLIDLRTTTELITRETSSLGSVQFSEAEISGLLASRGMASPDIKSNAPLMLRVESRGHVLGAKTIRLIRTPFISQYDNLTQKDDDGDSLTGFPTEASALLMSSQMTAHRAFSDPLQMRAADPALYDGIVYIHFSDAMEHPRLDAKQKHSFQVMDERGVWVGAEVDTRTLAFRDPQMGGERFNPETGLFEVAVTTHLNPIVHSMNYAFSNDVEPQWEASKVLDGSQFTIYSSGSLPSAENSRSVYLAVWMPQKQRITSLHLRARMQEGRALGFPQKYAIYLTNPENTEWIKQGEYTAQPGVEGWVRINFAQAQETRGVWIVPILLSTDGAQYRFQMADVNLVSYGVPLDFGKSSAVDSWVASARTYLQRLYDLGIHLSYFSLSEVAIEDYSQIRIPGESVERTYNNARLPYYYSPTFSAAALESFQSFLRASSAPASYQAFPLLPADYQKASAAQNPLLSRVQSAPPQSSLWTYWARWRRKIFNEALNQYVEALKQTSQAQSYVRSPLKTIFYNWPNWTSFNGEKLDMGIILDPAPQTYYHEGLLMPNAADPSQMQSFGPTVYVENGSDFQTAHESNAAAFDYFVYEVKYLNDEAAIQQAQRMRTFKESSPAKPKIGLHIDSEYPQYRDQSNYMNTNMSQVFPAEVRDAAFDLVWSWEAQCEYLLSMKEADLGYERFNIVGIADDAANDLGTYRDIYHQYSETMGYYCLYRHQHYNLQQVCTSGGSCVDHMPMNVLRENIRRLLDWRARYLEMSH